MDKHKYYAVAIGMDKETGNIVTNKIYNSWEGARKYVIGVAGSKYKGFNTKKDAQKWIDGVIKNIENQSKTHYDEMEPCRDNEDLHLTFDSLKVLLGIDSCIDKLESISKSPSAKYVKKDINEALDALRTAMNKVKVGKK